MKTTKTITTIILSVCCALLSAQKDPKTTVEEIESQCQGTPTAQRVTVSVSSFNVATPTAYAKFGDELSQMLTNALQNVNCFNVLLSLK
ncbi:MAG TPA: hypothetical protein PKD13_12845, partial [Mariniflexile sp.]|nr:hypothetical protein [Mariniflexile sp.]